jgi:hypothetical protein
MFTGETVGAVDDLNSFASELGLHQGAALLVELTDEPSTSGVTRERR